jgi:hypothetical protein
MTVLGNEGSAMSCLYCVAAHQRGRFWFCNRCGSLMLLRPSPARCPQPQPERRAAERRAARMASPAGVTVAARPWRAA